MTLGVAGALRYLSTMWGIDLSKGLLPGLHKTLVLPGLVSHGSEELLRGEDGFLTEDVVAMDSFNIVTSAGRAARRLGRGRQIDGSGSGGGGAAAAAAPFQAAGGGDGEVSAGGRAQVFLAAERGRPVDPVVWGDEERMKRELVAWAKAVASMAAAGKMSTTSSSTPSSPWPSARRRG
ncbi:uncharacterized protein LOC120669137 [Panicum virgatum]|uniref:uncharacterized protein LOC120669137 n=1 Tax=Panicum virgatum TaxID=38727 RepID=UPI0019D614B0|nr:uncharacterized protein LOC120669137 [Panicum virgatum]